MKELYVNFVTYQKLYLDSRSAKYKTGGEVLRFHGNIGYEKASQYYVIRTLLILFVICLFYVLR